jgi:hypothetical protein
MNNLQLTLETIASIDIQTLIKKDAEYGSSWKKRGGTGAFHQGIARKWDRLEEQLKVPAKATYRIPPGPEWQKEIPEYDIFARIEAGVGGSESILETLRDLRRYLLLVEAEIEHRKQVDRGGTVPNRPLTDGEIVTKVEAARPAARMSKEMKDAIDSDDLAASLRSQRNAEESRVRFRNAQDAARFFMRYAATLDGVRIAPHVQALCDFFGVSRQ